MKYHLKFLSIEFLLVLFHLSLNIKFEMVLFHLQSKIWVRKCKDVWNWLVLVIFSHFWRPWNLFGNIKNPSKFSQILCPLHIFVRAPTFIEHFQSSLLWKVLALCDIQMKNLSLCNTTINFLGELKSHERLSRVTSSSVL